MDESFRFPVMIAASIVVMFALIWLVTRGGNSRAGALSILVISTLVSGGGMLFAKYGANFNLPWTIYYTVPALLTIFLPPLYFRMSLTRSLWYIFLAAVSAPLIHYAFLWTLGWDEYMPFLNGLIE